MNTVIRNCNIDLSDVENEMYDRQIRLWGLESQKRLRTAKVLVAGMNGLGAEITKNIVLAGISSVTLVDEKVVTERDFFSQFLISRQSLGKNRAEASIERARKLNPMVHISAETERLLNKSVEFISLFNVVILTEATTSEILQINNLCRSVGVKFFAGDVWGQFGFFFADLQTHLFTEDSIKYKVISKPNEKVKTDVVTTTVKREIIFPSYSEVLKCDTTSNIYHKQIKRSGPGLLILRVLQQFRELNGRDPHCHSHESDKIVLVKLLQNLTSHQLSADVYFDKIFGLITPAASVLGGVLAQEILKVVFQKEAPHFNMFIFDPIMCCGFIEAIGIE